MPLGEKVLIIIGGDDNYERREEEKKTVISRWAWRKVSSQFEKEYLDGRKSFIFSWRKNHREIHERALLHFFEPSKVEEKFDYHPPEMSLPADTSIAIATAEENNQELNPKPEMTQSTPSNGPEYISLYPTDNVSVKLKFCSFTHYTRQCCGDAAYKLCFLIIADALSVNDGLVIYERRFYKPIEAFFFMMNTVDVIPC